MEVVTIILIKMKTDPSEGLMIKLKFFGCKKIIRSFFMCTICHGNKKKKLGLYAGKYFQKFHEKKVPSLLSILYLLRNQITVFIYFLNNYSQ